METNIVQYLPDWFRSILDYQELTGAETVEFGNFAELMSRVHDDMFVLTADESTVQDWEKIFGIVANPSVETLEFRRARILNRLTFNPPFTLEFLYERLDALIGVGKWAVVVDYANYTLYVEAAATNQAWAGEVLATVSTIKPCHIVYIDRPLLPAAILASETVDLTETVYNYRLGYWGIGYAPFASQADKGVIVTADQMTLQTQLFNDVATFAASDVAKARINGTTLMTAFDTKAASGNTAIIQYTVTPAQASTITKVELLNASGTVLESAPVYIPVSNPVQITHRIPVKEGV